MAIRKTFRYRPVNSSWINGFKRINEGVIRMRTHGGGIYDYVGSTRRFNAWLRAGTQPGRGPTAETSAGKYFHEKAIGEDLIRRVAKKGKYGK